MLITNEILSEYIEVIERRASHEVAVNVSEFLITSKNVERIEIYYNWRLISKDADDNKFVDCAINGSADYIVTDDKHFRMLSEVKFPLVKIIRTKDFTDLLTL